jgi:hypothetical protein
MTNLKSQYRRLFEGRTSSNDSSLLREGKRKSLREDIKSDFERMEFGKQMKKTFDREQYDSDIARQFDMLLAAHYQVHEFFPGEYEEFEALDNLSDKLREIPYNQEGLSGEWADDSYKGKSLAKMPDDFGGLGDLVDEGAPDEVLAQYLPTMYQSAAELGGGGYGI